MTNNVHNLFDSKTTTVIPTTTSQEMPSAQIRWNNGILEQAWVVITDDTAKSGEIKHEIEWRVVPSVGSVGFAS